MAHQTGSHEVDLSDLEACVQEAEVVRERSRGMGRKLGVRERGVERRGVKLGVRERGVEGWEGS